MATATSRSEPRSNGGIDLFGLLASYAPLIFLLVLMGIFAWLEPRFLLPLNLVNVMRQVSIYGLLALGMTFVILTAGIDLSVGALVAFAGLAAAAVAKGGLENRFTVATEGADIGYGWPLAMLVAILFGTGAGAIQGFATTRLKVPPFVVTLGGMSAFRGAALLMAGGGPISGFDEGYRWWGQGYLFELPLIGKIPVPVMVFLAFAVLAHVILRYTRYGRHIYGIGGNPEAARLSGLNVRGVTMSVYVIMGFMAGMSGFILSARLNSAEAVAGMGYELIVIASVVIGGTSLFGGRGSIIGTLVGALIVGVFRNGLALAGADSLWQEFAVGLLIIVAVAIDQWIRKASA